MLAQSALGAGVKIDETELRLWAELFLPVYRLPRAVRAKKDSYVRSNASVEERLKGRFGENAQIVDSAPA